MSRFSLLFTIGFVISMSAAAHDYMLGDIHIMQPWSRPLPPVSVNGAAYMTLMNKGDSPDRLLSVSTPAADKAEIHNHTMEGGLMKMRPVGVLDITPGDATVLQPGGLHVMLMGLAEPLVEGQSFPLTLHFERAGSIEVTVMIFVPDESAHGNMQHDTKGTGG